MRQICYTMIKGNPNIKNSAKPNTLQDYMRLGIDKDIEKKIEMPTPEDIEKAREYGKKLLNGNK